MKHPPNDRLGWFRYYVNRFNKMQHKDSAQMMALFYFALLVDAGEEPELA